MNLWETHHTQTIEDPDHTTPHILENKLNIIFLTNITFSVSGQE
jgi:hypothetical protein